MSNNIIKTVIEIHKEYRFQSTDVSSQTQSAQKITKKWQQQVVNGETIKSEVSVSSTNKERFDLVDYENLTVYELKVSGKNPHHEFYKNLIKLLTYNCHNETKLKKLVFLSEKKGIESLNKRIDSKLKEMLIAKHDVVIELISLT